jgi:hypothetical protein
MKKIKITKEQGLSIIRHTLTFVGGLVVMFGLIDESVFTELSGSVIALTGLVWSIIEKNKKENADI